MKLHLTSIALIGLLCHQICAAIINVPAEYATIQAVIVAPGTSPEVINLNSNSTVTNCSFSGNTAFNEGGGIFNNTYSSPMVTTTGF